MRLPGIVLVILVAAGAAASAVQAAGWAPSDPVQVHYPGDDCETGVLEIEVFSRSLQRWQPHPVHWRVLADTCQQEDAGELLNELRVRCVDLENPGRASEWQIGVQVYEPAEAPACVAPQSDAPLLADPRIELSSPAPGETVRNLSKTTELSGRVTLDHDFGVLLDARLDDARRAKVGRTLDGWIVSLAPLLGPVRVAWLPFAGPDANRVRNAAGASNVDMSSDAEALRGRLAKVWSAPPFGGVIAALEPILDAHERAAQDGRSLSLVVIVEGGAAFPFGRGAGADPHYREAVLAAVDRALSIGASLRIFVLGDDEPGLAELVDRVRERFAEHPGAGGLDVLGSVEALGPALARETPTGLRDLRVVNLANGVLAEPLQFRLSGAFEGDVALETGRNQLRVRAILSDGRELNADFDCSFDASMLRDHLRAEEAERIRSLRARDGIVDVEVEEP